MEFLLIERESIRRVAIAQHMCRSGHRVTLTASLAEARELFGFIDSEKECPSAVLIAEDLLGPRSTAFQGELARRFPGLAWVPVRADIDLGWLQNWLERLAANQVRARRRPLNILLIEPRPATRRELAHRLAALGDRVVARATLGAAAADVTRSADRQVPFDVLIAPVIAGGAETISLFLDAQKRLPQLRWIVPAAHREKASTVADIRRLRRSPV